MKQYFQGKIGRGNFTIRVIIYWSVLICASLMLESSSNWTLVQWIGLLLFLTGIAFFFNAIGLRLNDLKEKWCLLPINLCTIWQFISSLSFISERR